MKEKIDSLREIFMLLPTWSDRYNYLIELGEQLPEMPVAFQVSENRIECNSMIYFYVCYINDICYIFATANSPIPAGLSGLLFSLCDNISKKELSENLPYLIDTLNEIGLIDNLTPSRRDAFLSMIKKLPN